VTPPAAGRARTWALAITLTQSLAGLAAVGCDAGPKAPAVALLTLGSLREGFAAAPTQPLGVGLSQVFRGGFPPSYFLASPNQIRIASAFTQGQPTAYTTTDIWVNFPTVWAQPLYIFI